MGKIDKSDFGHLGKEFQEKLLQQVLTDEKFGEVIIDMLNPNYFGDSYLRDMAGVIRESYENDEVIPDLVDVKIRLNDKQTNEFDRSLMLKALHRVQEAPMKGYKNTQKLALKFCKQQELNKAIAEIKKITENGEIDDYDKCEEIIKKALEKGDTKDSSINVFDDIDKVLSEDFRNPIPTGIHKLDELMGGGLSKGELAVILAAFGVGKTTMITKIANSALNDGKNVLQIFFEDNPKVIQRKHYACWSGIPLNDFEERSDELKAILKEKQEILGKGEIRLKKMPSDGTTIPHIRQLIKKEMARGFRPDIVLIDYIDCIQPTKAFSDEWSGEGNVMRQFETMLTELDLAGWTAVQGNRSSINAEVVEADQIGGSIKKGQIGHFIVSIAKTLPQKENGTANMAILKSRFGKDGIILRDVTFNNATIQIQANEQDNGATFYENVEIKKSTNQDMVKSVLTEVINRKRDEAQ